MSVECDRLTVDLRRVMVSVTKVSRKWEGKVDIIRLNDDEYSATNHEYPSDDVAKTI